MTKSKMKRKLFHNLLAIKIKKSVLEQFFPAWGPFKYGYCIYISRISETAVLSGIWRAEIHTSGDQSS